MDWIWTSNPIGIVTTTATSTVGVSTTFSFEENSNYLQVPPEVLGVTKIFHFSGANTTANNMFSIKYQLFLNDIYFWGAMEMLTYNMTRTYLADLEFALTTQKQFRFNQRMDRLYLDVSWSELTPGDYLVIDCLRKNPHPSHFHFDETIRIAKKLSAKKTILTNLHVDLDYQSLKKKLPKNIVPAFDGLSFNF